MSVSITAGHTARPHPKTKRGLDWFTSLRAYCLSQTGREETINGYYVQSVLGNSSGGGGNGSIATPYLCRYTDDLFTLMNTRLAAGDRTFILRDNDVYHIGPSRNKTVTISVDNVTIRRTGTGTRKPIITGWEQGPAVGSWTQHVTYTNVWSFALGVTPYWVSRSPFGATISDWGDDSHLTATWRRRKIGGTYSEGTLATVLSSMNSTDRDQWVYDSGTLYIRPHSSWAAAWSGGTALVAYITQSGDAFVISGDGCLIDGLRTEGFGMQSDASQNYHYRATFGTGKACTIVGAEAYFGSHHMIARLANDISSTGGTFAAIDCKAGWCTTDTNGVATIFNDYVHLGVSETVLDNCEVKYGALETEVVRSGGAVFPSIEAFYGHSSSESYAPQLCVVRGCSISYDAPTYAYLWLGGIYNGSASAVTAEDLNTYLVFMVDTTDNGRPTSSAYQVLSASVCRGTSGIAAINCQFLNQFNPGSAVSPSVGMLGAYLSGNKFAYVNCIVQADLSNKTTAASLVLFQNNLGAAAQWFVHCEFIVKSPAYVAEFMAFFNPWYKSYLTGGIRNCVVAIDMDPPSQNHYPCWKNDSTYLRGLAALNLPSADFDTNYTGYSAATAKVDSTSTPAFTAFPTTTTTPLTDPSWRRTGVAVSESGLAVEYDINGNPRGSAVPDIGAYTSAGRAGAGTRSNRIIEDRRSGIR